MRMLAFILLLWPSLAFGAPDREPKLAILGFAPDGSAFAFEQFGWSSGDGYPYSDLSVIDPRTGKPFVGAPFQTLVAQDDAKLERVRMISYTSAQSMLVSMKIGEPGIVAGRASGDPRDPAATALSFDAPTLGMVTVKLDGAVVKSAACEAVGVKVRVLAIRLLDEAGTVIRNLYKEKNPDGNRFCPTGYALAEIRMFPRKDKPPVLGIVIGFNRPGVGGVDRRYIGFAFDLATEPEAAEEEGH
jgi:predicted secreted protein